MKDKWMNIGFEEDELKPYNEPLPDLNDQMRIGEFIFDQFNNLFLFIIIVFDDRDKVRGGNNYFFFFY